MFALTSKNLIKVTALEEFFGLLKEHFEIKMYPTVNLPTAEQPINSVEKCAKRRIENVKQNYDIPEESFIISIENGIVVDKDDRERVYDVVCVVIEYGGKQISGYSNKNLVHIPYSWYQQSFDRMMQENPNYEHKDDGLDITLGKTHVYPYLEKIGQNQYSHDNWSGYPEFGGIDRKIQLADGLYNAFTTFLKQFVRFTPDYPKSGVIFQDVNKIMADPILNKLMNCMIVATTKQITKPTKIVGLDARGFIYGAALAALLGCGFVPLRKAGKQSESWGLSRVNYGTEYSNDIIELETSLINSDDTVLIYDDLLATGGTLKAAITLVANIKPKAIYLMTNLKVDELYDEACKKIGADVIVVLK
jgi:adenine phosphoribosyltransferase